MKLTALFTALIIGLNAFAQFPIGEQTITYNDPIRSNRPIECQIYYPAVSNGSNTNVASGQFPVIVLGHGFAMTVNAYQNWWEEFVPKGYIMVLPTTEGSLFPAPSHQDFGMDLRFMAETMQSENSNSGSPFYQHVSDRTTIMGHSMGGGATIIGASGFSGVDCIVGLAPAETNPSAIAAAENVTAPALVLSGEDDSVTPPNDHHIPIYDALGSSCKTYVTVNNGSHCYFANYNFNCAFGEIIPGSLSRENQLQVSYDLIHPFFNYFLRDSCEAWDEFSSELQTNSDINSHVDDCHNEAPVISDNSGTLESSSSGNYQWYLDGQPIPGADQQSHTYSTGGIYQVGTISIGNCEVLSNELVVQITGLQSPFDQIKISRSSEGISIQQLPANILSISTLDMTGRMIESNSSGNGLNMFVPLDEIKTPVLIRIGLSDGQVHTLKVL